MSAILIALGLALLLPVGRVRGDGPISLPSSTTYTQSFDSLAKSGTSSVVPAGWAFAESGTNANTSYTAGTGSANNGDTYSFGASGSTDRAFGTLQSGSLIPTVGASFTNDTGAPIAGLTVAYTGEQWRLGATSRPDRLDFQYSLNATSLTSGTWIDVDALDFSSPITGPTVGPLDGNAATNRTPVASTISGLSIPNGARFWIRWADFNASGADDGLAVDDFSLTPTPAVLAASGAASPAALSAGESTLLTVQVTPGTNPPSSGVVVRADLSSIGGSTAEAFAGSGNTFTFEAVIAPGTTAGAKVLPVTVSDAEGRSGSTSIGLQVQPPPAPVDHLVISQIYGGGGNSGATFRNDYVELYNPTAAPFELAGWTLQYASATGSAWGNTSQPLGGVIAPGEYYLVTLASGGLTGADLPPANIIGAINISAITGKIALVRNGEPLSGLCPLADPELVDFVGYGTTATCREGATNAPAPSNTSALFRLNAGSVDTNDNAQDFATGAPNPRQTAPITEIGPGVFNTDPGFEATDAPRDASLTVNFTEPVDVTGAWFTVSCDMTGSHDDATVAGGPRSYVITPNRNFLAGERCTVTIDKNQVHDQDLDDAQPNTDTLVADYSWGFTVAVGAAPPYPPEVHLTMGNPSGATADLATPNNYLMEKPEFALSYNRDRGTPNWVSWHLSDEWVGHLGRVDTFRPDPAVPSDWYRVQATDYFGSGFDRGHMTPNADRDNENSRPINQATFLMTNMVPQAPDNNQGPWANLENYLRTLLPDNELYIVAGGAGTGGTGSAGLSTSIAGGRVSVPAQTWKVALVIPKAAGDDVSRVSASTRTIAVIMPNTQGIRTTNNDDWRQYLVSVDTVESLTGYDFFSNVADIVENSIEAGVNGLNPPGVADQLVTAEEDTPKALTLEAVSANDDPLTFTVVDPPAHGLLAGSGAGRTYTPAPDFTGEDVFTFRAADGTLGSNTAKVTIRVLEENDAPTAAADSKSTDEDTSLTFPVADLTANDAAGPDNESGQTLTVTAVTATTETHGTVTLGPGEVTYTPAPDFNGSARFTYRVCDDGSTAGLPDPKCATGTAELAVRPVNDPPVLAPIAGRTVLLGDTLTFTALASDIDVPVQSLRYGLAGAVPDGALIDGATGAFTWTSSGAQAGATYAFDVVVSDGFASAATAVRVTVVDATPPAISNLSLSATQLWPPDHRMVDVAVGYRAADAGDPMPVCSVTVTSSEPVDEAADGSTAPDWEIAGAHQVRLRAERAGSGNGRTYNVLVGCVDRAGNKAERAATVTVPRSQAGTP